MATAATEIAVEFSMPEYYRREVYTFKAYLQAAPPDINMHCVTLASGEACAGAQADGLMGCHLLHLVHHQHFQPIACTGVFDHQFALSASCVQKPLHISAVLIPQLLAT